MRRKIKSLKQGDKYNHWTVIEPEAYRINSHTKQLCKCDCGNEVYVEIKNILNGKSTKCLKCARKELIRKSTKHNECNTRLHIIWSGMLNRCGRLKNYENIKVCDEWKKYENFRDWALNHGYRDDLTIDRINGLDNYYPENCRWTTYQMQAFNKKRKSGCTTPYYGVVKRKNKETRPFQCSIRANMKTIHLGYFDTAEEAALAYNNYIDKHNLLNNKNEIKNGR